MKLDNFKAVTFDVYGTLVNWEPVIGGFLAEWAADNGVQATEDDLIQAYDDARAHYQTLRPAMPYPKVMKSSFAYICDRWQIPVDTARQDAFAASIKDWLPFPDTVGALRELSEHMKLGALSNIDERSFQWTLEKLEVPFDFTVTAERVGSYKPAFPHFVTAAFELGERSLVPAQWLHVCQSLRADVRPANDLGISCAWINRTSGSLGLTGHGAEAAVPDMTYATLAELVDAFRDQSLGN